MPGLPDPIATTRPLLWKLSAAFLIVLLAIVLCSRMSHPWTYNDDYNGAFWSQAARNLNRAGFFSTAGVPAPLYFGAPPIPREALYVHHPTLLADMMLVDLWLLGESERAARALPICFSVLTGLLLWYFVGRFAGWRMAAFTLAFFVAAPMELHYGQMVNFEAPELFFLLAALCSHHLWRARPNAAWATMLILSCIAAMATDWQGYLLVIILSIQLMAADRRAEFKMGAALFIPAALCGIAFLMQIRLAMPGAWHELYSALRERSSHADLSGGAFTMGQWLRVEYGYLTTLFHPLTWLLAMGGAIVAWFERRKPRASERPVLHIAAVLFLIDAFYVCALRNQSYIHDFASFYFLVPLAIYSGFFVDRIIRSARALGGEKGACATTACCCAMAMVLLWFGVRSLATIDTPFCILDNNTKEPDTLMPDVGRLIDRTFPANAVVICNFDQYYSPLPFYARRIMVNNLHTVPDWSQAVADAAPQPAGGIIWTGVPDAGELARHFPPSQTHVETVDGVAFLLWTPASR
jgi:hypothetical protein